MNNVIVRTDWECHQLFGYWWAEDMGMDGEPTLENHARWIREANELLVANGFTDVAIDCDVNPDAPDITWTFKA